MRLVKCFDVVTMVIDEATDQFGVSWAIDEDKESAIREDCIMIDEIADDFGGDAYEVCIDDISMDITVSLTCGELVLASASHDLYRILQHTKKFSVTATEDPEYIRLDFVFPGVWRRA